ncbi:MAG: arginine--tRNA ligase [Candidatus Omnitrophica bacterium]|nr:arginine--tRNA ligase [Candidatus Omnitrophota bacterium]
MDFSQISEIILEQGIKKAVKKIMGDQSCPDIIVGAPRDPAHGDLSSSIALQLTKILKKNPVQIAETLKTDIIELLDKKIPGLIESVNVVNPGFINFILSKEYAYEVLKTVEKEGGSFGSSKNKDHHNIQIEFVSANPTGPLTVAHGRQAAVGDALANILKFMGNNVTKEFYINDEGRQINVLGDSILYHYLAAFGKNGVFPEDGYQGEYIKGIALRIKDEYNDKFVKDPQSSRDFFRKYGADFLLNIIKEDLKQFKVDFDSWFSQKNITKSDIDKVLSLLKEKGYIYQQDGALWFKSTDFNDEKDRVVVKSDGQFTYFAPDIAYHKNKYERGFDKLINIWGPDHHGYIPRITAAAQALGHDHDAIKVLIVQLATIYKNGQELSMSTRKGEFISLKEVMDEVGEDVTKFCFLMRNLDTHLDFDLDKAKEQSADNPVYYIQYAHARIWSIHEKAGAIDLSKADLSLLKEEEEIAIAKTIGVFPKTVRSSAEKLEPFFVISYLNELASKFHNFYGKYKVITDDNELLKARLFLIDCVKICLANGLKLLGVSLPKKM